MLQAIVFIMICAAVLLLIDGVCTGFSVLSTLIGGAFVFIIKGLGIILGVVLAMYLVLLAIF
tara:strand:- start:271 stop:456 length:186 start_codon:yes stop_codon:yes gene_type:complete